MILLIDNYDSFVFNVRQYVAELTNEQILCVRNDEITLDEIRHLAPTHIILSPGPKHPKDSGVCLEILRSDIEVPILGICLGHQAIGLSYGGKIKQLSHPLHGKTSNIDILCAEPLFSGLPSKVEVMRYHSLYVDELSDELQSLAVSEDGVCMALRVKNRKIFGIQFHPESYFSQYGKKMIENFLNIDKKEQKRENQMINFAPYMVKLQNGIMLDGADYAVICKAINDKEYDIVQLAGLLVLISEKSLYAQSVAALVTNILKYSQTYTDTSDMFDIVGTGGDRLKTINVSTTVAFILASLGVKVAKHGGKAVTSKSGSSDTLSALGVKLSASIDENRAKIQKQNLAFFHAPFFHNIMAEVKEVRERLKIGTCFNMMGPLLNPNLGLKFQMVGNYLEPVNELMAQTLLTLGRKHALVVHGMDGMDEITLCDETLIHEVKDGKILSYRVTPEQFGFQRAFHADIEGGTSEENAEILRATLRAEVSGAKFDIVVLNAMFALYAADFVKSPSEAKPIILEAISSGRAWKFYQEYIKE
ncbi:anthranilate phosphoribosyltransferase [Campylobacter suis]|uniref:Anthranilate phosphoribosyltransferase n=1 Tax=Campylobacter suis TaxID=2790657 RepID=A0ABM8Q0C7_9BACT|nr:anthranilate phosphoribosyltransferase [Campylobacter suis]CAD7286245.1 Bifunctional protein TrpGD [Campylobacter suis]